MALPQWRNVSANVGNGAGYFGQGASLINQAFKTAQDGISKYQEQEKENANTREANNTAKLLDIAKTRPLTQADYDVAGMVDRATLNKVMSEQEKQAHDIAKGEHGMGIADSNLALDRRKTTAQIAKWRADAKAATGKPSYLEKKMIDARLALSKEEMYKDNQLGSYFDKSKSKFGSSTAGKFMEAVGLTTESTNSKGETVHGSIDIESGLDYQNAINQAIAKGRTKKEITSAMSRNTSKNNWTSNFTPQDEMDFNVAGFLRDLQL